MIGYIKCGEHEDKIKNTAFLSEYLNRPRPFTCTLYNGVGAPDCKFAAQ